MAASLQAVRTAAASSRRSRLRESVPEPDLFAAPASPLVLIDDVQGGFRYWPGFVDPDTAQAWFEALRDGVAWESQQRPMYDRMVDVPRLLAAFRVAEIPDGLPLRTMLDRVRALAPAPYNAAGLNLYRDGRDSVAMHNDKLHSLTAGHPIALVSLGAPRRMLIRAKASARETVAVELTPGSLLRMSHAAQSTHEHGIPKTKRAVGQRMSVVFRVRPDAASPYGGMRPG